mmetsp:Transcript_32391/g.76863  ORF Transcript_32391/g.76863 Transcript_32391/m.76863 type:complete len:202 (+) Transcript_32391:1781-2386(+)
MHSNACLRPRCPAPTIANGWLYCCFWRSQLVMPLTRTLEVMKSAGPSFRTSGPCFTKSLKSSWLRPSIFPMASISSSVVQRLIGSRSILLVFMMVNCAHIQCPLESPGMDQPMGMSGSPAMATPMGGMFCGACASAELCFVNFVLAMTMSRSSGGAGGPSASSLGRLCSGLNVTDTCWLAFSVALRCLSTRFRRSWSIMPS